MKINRNNYESYFIDYLEGNLDKKLVNDFIEFLAQNPDLNEELTLFESIAIEAVTAKFDKKELLYKERFDLESEFAEAAIAKLEGDLTANEKIEFENYITNHPERKPDVAIFEKTKLAADQTIVFQKKQTLYKTTPIKTILLWSGRVAALLVISIMAYFYIAKNQKTPIDGNSVAVIEPKNTTNNLAIEPVQERVNSVIQPKLNKNKSITNRADNETNSVKNKRQNYTAQSNQVDIPQTQINPIHLAQLQSLPATVATKLPETELEIMFVTIPIVEILDEYLLVDKIKDKTNVEKISLKKITQAGLSLISSLTSEKFRYQTNETGKVTEIVYNSPLLAFTIPTTRNIGEANGK